MRGVEGHSDGVAFWDGGRDSPNIVDAISGGEISEALLDLTVFNQLWWRRYDQLSKAQ